MLGISGHHDGVSKGLSFAELGAQPAESPALVGVLRGGGCTCDPDRLWEARVEVSKIMSASLAWHQAGGKVPAHLGLKLFSGVCRSGVRASCAVELTIFK